MPTSNDVPQDFQTHFNYAKCMNGMMHDISFAVPLAPIAHIEIRKVRKFIKLAQLTKTGIENEVQACREVPDYSEVVAPWLPVKHYYRLYYLESVLIHLTQGNSGVFVDGGHRLARNMITSFCRSGYVSSRLREAQKVVLLNEAMQHRIRPGQNISSNYYLTQECIKSVRSKVATYVLDHWKLNKGWKRYSSPARRAERDRYKASKAICLLDFFYQMRLKANYRDIDFLSSGEITSAQKLEYIKMYHSAAVKYGRSLEIAIQNAARQRNISLS